MPPISYELAIQKIKELIADLLLRQAHIQIASDDDVFIVIISRVSLANEIPTGIEKALLN